MIVAYVRGWTDFDTAAMAAEAATAFVLLHVVVWAVDPRTWRRWRSRPVSAAAPAAAHPRADHQLYESSAWTAGEPTGEDPQ